MAWRMDLSRDLGKDSSREETAEMLGEDIDTIGKIYDAIKITGTDDAGEICEQYVRMK